MPQTPLDEPSRRVHADVFTRDLAYIKAHDHRPMSQIIRELLREHCRAKRKESVAQAMQGANGYAQRD